MFSIDKRDIIQFEHQLKTFAEKAYPFATRNTINTAAFATQKAAKENIRNSMTLRNKFTERSIKVVPDKRNLDVDKQVATVGSTAPYMAKQEYGDTETSSGKEGVAIATSYAAGQQGQKPRTRLPRKPNLLQNIRLSKRKSGRAGNKMQANLIAVKHAAESGNRYVFLDLRRGAGIFKVVGGKKRPRIKMLYDLSRKTVVIPKNPWMSPAVETTEPKILGYYKDSLEFQLKRQKLFGR
tara:strand:- start:1969 stop:2682 length:714 start_codon:yes stop_codon:yes gene_type:complete